MMDKDRQHRSGIYAGVALAEALADVHVLIQDLR